MENEIKIREKYRSKISQYKLSLTRSNHLLKNSIRQSKSELRQIKEQNQYNQKKYMDMIEATFSHEEICFFKQFFKEQDAKLEQLINETLDERNEFVHSEPSISELNETMSFEKINGKSLLVMS